MPCTASGSAKTVRRIAIGPTGGMTPNPRWVGVFVVWGLMAVRPARQRMGLHDPRTGREQGPPPKVHDDPAATLSACPRPIRRLAVTGLGHDEPTLRANADLTRAELSRP